MPKPQSFCSLPWCGKSFAGPAHGREFIVDGKKIKFIYPSMIDMHDIVPRSLGGDKTNLDNNVPICHDCHMAHHDARPHLEFRQNEEQVWQVRRPDDIWRDLRLADDTEGA